MDWEPEASGGTVGLLMTMGLSKRPCRRADQRKERSRKAKASSSLDTTTSFLLCAQAIEQIARVTLFAATALARGRGGPRVKPIPFIEQSQKLRFPIHDFPEIQTGFSQGARLVGGR